jgi:hypothetical protein
MENETIVKPKNGEALDNRVETIWPAMKEKKLNYMITHEHPVLWFFPVFKAKDHDPL